MGASPEIISVFARNGFHACSPLLRRARQVKLVPWQGLDGTRNGRGNPGDRRLEGEWHVGFRERAARPDANSSAASSGASASPPSSLHFLWQPTLASPDFASAASKLSVRACIRRCRRAIPIWSNEFFHPETFSGDKLWCAGCVATGI